jgi:hypothetical protein
MINMGKEDQECPLSMTKPWVQFLINAKSKINKF